LTLQPQTNHFNTHELWLINTRLFAMHASLHWPML